MQSQQQAGIIAYTNDLCRLASKAQQRRLHDDDLRRLQHDIDAIWKLASNPTSTTTRPSSPPSAALPASPSRGRPISAEPSTPPSSSSPPPSSGFLSSTLSALSSSGVLLQRLSNSDQAACLARSEVDGLGDDEDEHDHRRHHHHHHGRSHVHQHQVDIHEESSTSPTSVSSQDMTNTAAGRTSPDGVKRRNRGKNLPKDVKRCCTICKVEKTSQWRSGADGRPTLCNACGLRYRHSMKQHRQYLARKKVAERARDHEDARDDSMVVERQQILEVLRLHHQHQQAAGHHREHLNQADSADTIDECHSPLEGPSTGQRRSSIYMLLN